ncbi:M23 family metallopeptidase [Solimicrobium silvestre]|uniref:Peptidase family M23 n=1 Tax=Solimicrobium silvestre TaxID=2099400 RepID=A0A2S9GV80_9BURK|nr:peptidoglycan DD-metalloendopeptidase family protein [Solimicrobium silvestre]PRC91566.1 Peptidase family M23 [Solimicrobium silvestre]
MPSLNKTTNSAVTSALDSVTKLVSGSTRKTRIITVSALFLTLVAFGAAGVAPLAPDASDLPVRQIVEQLQIPTLEAQMQALEESDQQFIHEEKVQRGDTLASLLQRLGVDDAAANTFIKSDNTARLVMQQKAGKTVRAQTNEDGELQWLQTNISDNRDNLSQVKNITITRQDGTDTFKVAEASTALERHIEMHTGEITSSLFAATDAAQIPDAVASQLVDMFSTNIDFKSDLRRGDHFQLVYETFWQNGEMVSTGKVLAGEFNNAGRSYQSVWFDDAPGTGGYYGFDGKSMKKAFLKSPIAFTRISSGFSMRVHPISGQWKQHTGVDFAAPTGTPIRASADGVVDVAGPSGGYGNLVVLKHWGSYSTAYGHMSRFAAGMRKGVKVQQGDIIGYVGSTGWATGPHLHYEFRVNNKAQDPLKIKVEQAQTLTAVNQPRFNTTVQDVQHRFALLRPNDAPAKIATR